MLHVYERVEEKWHPLFGFLDQSHSKVVVNRWITMDEWNALSLIASRNQWEMRCSPIRFCRLHRFNLRSFDQIIKQLKMWLELIEVLEVTSRKCRKMTDIRQFTTERCPDSFTIKATERQARLMKWSIEIYICPIVFSSCIDAHLFQNGCGWQVKSAFLNIMEFTLPRILFVLSPSSRCILYKSSFSIRPHYSTLSNQKWP